MNSLTSNITMFFTSYLSNTVGYSENTIKSYRDTFVLLFSYAEEEHLIKRGKISIELFHKDTITAFLEWLESKRGVSVATRNQRLAALKSFSRYMSLSAVEYIDTFQAVLDIPPKKGSSKTVDYLTVEAMFRIDTALLLIGMIRVLFPLPVTIIVAGEAGDKSPYFRLISSCTLQPDS